MKRKHIIKAMIFFVALTAIFQSGCGSSNSQMENTSTDGSSIETSVSVSQTINSDGISTTEQSIMSSAESSEVSSEESPKESSSEITSRQEESETTKVPETTNPSEESKIKEPSSPAESSKPAEISNQESSKPAETSKQESSKPVEASRQESSKPVETSKPAETSKPIETSGQESSKPVEVSKPVETSKQESSTAPAPVMAESVKLNVHSLTMTVGDRFQLSAVISPNNTDSKHLTWSWDDASVVSMDKNAIVSALGAGTATITVKTDNGKKDTCKVTVKAKEQPKPAETSKQESSKPAETSKPTETSKPSEPSKQESSTPTDPILAAYTAPYDWDAVIADLRKVGEQQYGMTWEESLWVRNRGREFGSKLDEIYPVTWATDDKGNKYYQGNCQFGFPIANTEAYDGEPFRNSCIFMFGRLERRLAKSDEYLEGTLFKIVVEDVGINDNGDQEYWVYLLYT